MLDAREAVKMLLAINGGAAVSILALIGGLLTQKAPQLIELLQKVSHTLRYVPGSSKLTLFLTNRV